MCSSGSVVAAIARVRSGESQSHASVAMTKPAVNLAARESIFPAHARRPGDEEEYRRGEDHALPDGEVKCAERGWPVAADEVERHDTDDVQPLDDRARREDAEQARGP